MGEMQATNSRRPGWQQTAGDPDGNKPQETRMGGRKLLQPYVPQGTKRTNPNDNHKFVFRYNVINHTIEWDNTARSGFRKAVLSNDPISHK